MTFRDGVRRRLRNLYHDLEIGRRKLTRNIARTLVMTHEHEGWHIEVSGVDCVVEYSNNT